ncbi:hypothetical protein JW859_00710 [bacterium]|nr:hypothetical protein [bacterium]
MKIRTIEELQDALDREFAWRRRELTFVRSQIKDVESVQQNMLRRAGVALLYAHWEGFIKAAATYYVCHLKSKRLRNTEIINCLQAVSLKGALHNYIETKTPRDYIAAFSQLIASLGDRSTIEEQKVIPNTSNLNSDQFLDIVCALGFDVNRFSLKGTYIDKELLAVRNSIAHGEDSYPKYEDYKRLHETVSSLLEKFKDEVMLCATESKYLKLPVAQQTF